jgi:hypothetical protein
MGFFDFLKKGKKAPAAPPEEEVAPAEPEPEPPPDAIVVLREGMSTPGEDDMVALITEILPDGLSAPRRGLSQPRWWPKEEWLSSGIRGVASALRAELGIDPDKTSWKLGKDARGARVAVVILRK